MWDSISNGLSSLFGGTPTGVNASAGIGATNQAPTGGLWNFLTGDKFTNGLEAGTGLFGAFNDYKTSKLANKGFKQNMSIQKDVYNREKEADEKRQALNF